MHVTFQKGTYILKAGPWVLESILGYIIKLNLIQYLVVREV